MVSIDGIYFKMSEFLFSVPQTHRSNEKGDLRLKYHLKNPKSRELAIAAMHGPHSVFYIVTVRLCTVMLQTCHWLTNEKQRKTDITLMTNNWMIPQTDKSWRDYRALNPNWSYQPYWPAMQLNLQSYIFCLAPISQDYCWS